MFEQSIAIAPMQPRPAATQAARADRGIEPGPAATAAGMGPGVLTLRALAAAPPTQAELAGDVPPADPALNRAVLTALALMAVSSKRRQADLAVALRRARLSAPAEDLRAVLAELFDSGCIDGVVPLSDGGVLLSVTSLGIERIGPGQIARAA